MADNPPVKSEKAPLLKTEFDVINEEEDTVSNNSLTHSVSQITGGSQSINSTNFKKREDALENWQVSMHIIKASIGTGILGLPLSLNLAGLIVGPVVILLMGLVSVHCMQLLATCSQRLAVGSTIQRLDYGELTNILLKATYPKYAKLGSTIVNILLCLLQLGLCCVYLQFVADNCYQLFSECLTVTLWTTILLPFVLLPAMIKSLKVLSYVSLLSNILAVAGLLGVLYYLVFNIKEVEGYSAWGGFSKFFIFFGQAVFAFQAIGVVLPVEIKARKRQDFIKVMSISMMAVIALYLIVAILGFMAFGKNTMASITLNLPETPFYQVVRGSYTIAIYLTYFLQFYVPVSIITPLIKGRWSGTKGSVFSYLARITLVLLTYCASISTSQLGDSIAFVGSIAGSAVLFIIPSFLHTLLLWKEKSEWKVRLWLIKDMIIVVLGITGAIAGTYESINDMVLHSRNR